MEVYTKIRIIVPTMLIIQVSKVLLTWSKLTRNWDNNVALKRSGY